MKNVALAAAAAVIVYLLAKRSGKLAGADKSAGAGKVISGSVDSPPIIPQTDAVLDVTEPCCADCASSGTTCGGGPKPSPLPKPLESPPADRSNVFENTGIVPPQMRPPSYAGLDEDFGIEALPNEGRGQPASNVLASPSIWYGLRNGGLA